MFHFDTFHQLGNKFFPCFSVLLLMKIQLNKTRIVFPSGVEEVTSKWRVYLYAYCEDSLLPLGCSDDPVVSRFSELLFLDLPGTATEQVRTCGFRRNSSSFDKVPKIRDFLLLNSFESFLVTLTSISSETWEM